MVEENKAQDIIDTINPDNIQCSKCKKYFREELMSLVEITNSKIIRWICPSCALNGKINKEFDTLRQKEFRHGPR